MRRLLMILSACAVGTFWQVAAQEVPRTELPDSVIVSRMAGFGSQLRRPCNTIAPFTALPEIPGVEERAGLYSRRTGALHRDPNRSYIIAPRLPEKVKVLGMRPFVPRRLSVNNGNAANWDNPYPSAYLDARTLSFPMRGCPRP